MPKGAAAFALKTKGAVLAFKFEKEKEKFGAKLVHNSGVLGYVLDYRPLRNIKIRINGY